MDEAPAKDTDRYFEEIETGESLTLENARTLTETDVVNFAGVSGDFHELHMSITHAESSQFDGRVVHGNLVFSIGEALIADMNPKSFSYGYDNLRFVNPAYIDDTLTCHREIIERDDYNDRLGRVVYKYEVENQSGETLLACEHITLVEKRSNG